MFFWSASRWSFSLALTARLASKSFHVCRAHCVPPGTATYPTIATVLTNIRNNRTRNCPRVTWLPERSYSSAGGGGGGAGATGAAGTDDAACAVGCGETGVG